LNIHAADKLAMASVFGGQLLGDYCESLMMVKDQQFPSIPWPIENSRAHILSKVGRSSYQYSTYFVSSIIQEL
jgi:hypothetical protein